MGSVASVILCTFNRARLLRRALEGLGRQTLTLDRFEVVVVNDGSCDDTAEVCARAGEALPNLRAVSTGGNVGLAAAANLGVRAARGDHLLFTDDDCIAREDWAERTVDALRTSPIVAGAIASPRSPYLLLCHNVAQFHPFMGRRAAGPIGAIAGANMGWRRSILEELRGFDEASRTPDTELVLRARRRGYGVHFAPEAVVTHVPERATLRVLLAYAAEHAASTILLRQEYRALLRTPFVLRAPSLLLLLAPLIALKVTGHIYLSRRELRREWRTAPVVYGLKLAWCWGAAWGLWRGQRGDDYV